MNLPKPNPKDPVHYASWLNQHFEVDSPDNAAQDYIAQAAAWREYALTDEEIRDEPNAEALMEERMELSSLLIEAENAPWTAEQYPLVNEWLDKKEPYFAAFDQASRKKRCFYPVTQDSIRKVVLTNLESVSTVRSVLRHFAADGWRHVAKGCPQRMVENMLTVLRAVHRMQSFDVMSRIVPNAIGERTYPVLMKVLSHASNPGALAEEMLPLFDDADPEWPSLRSDFNGDRHPYYYRLQSMAEWDESEQETVLSREKGTRWAKRWNKQIYDRVEIEDLIPKEKLTDELLETQHNINEVHSKVLEGSFVRYENWHQANFEETLAELDRFYETLASWADQPWHIVGRKNEPYERLITDSNNALFKSFFSKSDGMSYVSFRERLERCVAMRNGVRTLYSIFSHQHRHGTVPNSLDEVEVLGGSELKLDPFSGKELIYKQTNDGFVLYSVACDQKDDGGQHRFNWGVPAFPSDDWGNIFKADGDYVFWPVQKHPEQEQS